MKKLVLIIALGMFLAGCAGIKQSEYLEHDSHYKDWSHLGFSWWGFKNVTEQAADKIKPGKMVGNFLRKTLILYFRLLDIAYLS